MMESCPHVEISAQKGGGTPVNSRKKNRKKGGIVLAVLLLLIAVAGFEVVQVYAQISDAQAQEQALRVQVEQQKQANAYIKNGSMQITASRDLFLYREVSRTKKDSSRSSDSGSSRSVGGGKF